MPFIWLTAIASFYEYIGTIFKIDTVYWFQIYPLLSFLSIYFFFFKVLSFRYLKMMKYLFLSFLVVYSLSFFYLENDNFISTSFNRLFISFFVFILSILWFKDVFHNLNTLSLFDKIKIQYLWNSEMFYFVAGLFIYYTTTFFLFLSSNTIYKSELYFYDYWFVNILATLVLRLCLIISVWKMRNADKVSLVGILKNILALPCYTHNVIIYPHFSY